ncbi:MAG: heavy metal translocating P-type ATPase [Firmicutes bacterium]|nr:heavy metal translocating P-type ATPase [Bacillota bacterium]NBI64763.1 heavy metal translocating P-type ATPase [Clostridiales bacterium]
MRFVIKHEIKGRLRIRVIQKKMTCLQADQLQCYLCDQLGVISVRVRERLCDAVICYQGERNAVLDALKTFEYDQAELPDAYLRDSERVMNRGYKDKLVSHVALRGLHMFLLPASVRKITTIVKSVKYLRMGIQALKMKKLRVEILDATAIGISMLRDDFKTAGSIMFLLGIGEILEEWTRKKTIGDLARSMSLNIDKVWCWDGKSETLMPASDIQLEDMVSVHMGSVIPFDGVVISGEAMVNQSSLTGESVPVHRGEGASVYAGTVVEEGELIVQVKETSGASKFEKIVAMIEDTEKLKSSLEGNAERLADRLVPYTLVGAILAWVITHNPVKALTILMVDFSCALKLAMPISVLSAMREAGKYQITVKGGKYMEAMADADTIIFDKTGTLTKARPTVADVVPFNTEKPDELLRIAACLEEHFPHSIAKAVVDEAKVRNLEHEELHSEVEYLVAHGISSMVDGKKTVIGSYHFVFEDEKCTIDKRYRKRFESLRPECSHLYMAIEGRLAAAICINDPLREEAADVVKTLKQMGIKKVVMMTGDGDRTAKVIAEKAGVDEYYSEVLPEDKAKFVEQEKSQGKTVVMIGDGINDSPALSAADIGIAIHDGAEIAREIADVTIGADNLRGLVTLKLLSDRLMERIQRNYRTIIGVNGGVILLGLGGILQPTTSALLHNVSTLAIGLRSMSNLLE